MKSRVANRLLTQVTRTVSNRPSAFASTVSRISGSTSFTQNLPLLLASDIQWFSSSTNDDDSEDLNHGTQVTSEEYKEGHEDDFGNMAYANFDEDEEFDDDYSRNHRSLKSEQEDDEEEAPRRIWLDPSTKLEDRVEKFLSRKLGTMHPLDIRLASVDLIRECGKMNSFEGMKFAHDILDRILEEKRFVNQQHESGNSSGSVIFVAERPFQVLMYGWSNLCRKVSVAPERMREVLDLMIQEAEYDEKMRQELRAKGNIDEELLESLPSCQPTVDIYNTLLQGLGQASFRSIAAAGEAEAVVNVMMRMNQKHGWHTKPNTKSFTLAITAFSKTQHSTAGKRAEAILRLMTEYHETEKELYLEETGTDYDLHDPSSNRRRIVTPDTIAYSAVIQAYAHSNASGSAEQARALLEELLASDHPSLVPDAYIFANTINAYAKVASKKKSPKARMEAAESAEALVWLMVDQLLQLTPDNNEGDSVENPPPRIAGEKKRKSRRDGLCSIVPFNACLNAWAESNAPGSANRAEELLHKILDPEFRTSTGIVPNATSFNTCMQAWAKGSRHDDSAPEKAEELLSLLTSSSEEEESNTSIVTADITSYSTVMTAYAKSNRPDKAVHTRRLLETLISNSSSSSKLNVVPFTVVLNAVAHSPSPYDPTDSLTTSSSSNTKNQEEDAFGTNEHQNDDSDAFLDSGHVGGVSTVNADDDDDAYSIALKTYMELQEDTHNLRIYPDHLVYATMLDVIAKHTDVESIGRRQKMEEILADACRAGEVSSLVVASLQKACPSADLLQELLQVSNPAAISSVNALPRAWTRRVAPRFRRLKGSDHKSKGGGRRRNTNNFNRKGKEGKRKASR